MIEDGISGRMFTIAAWIIGALFAVVGGLLGLVWSNNNSRIKDVEDDIYDIKKDYVSRNTLMNMQSEWREEMRQLREDRKAMHDENKGWMLRIETKIDSFKEDYLPHQFAQMLSDVYGTIANNKRDFERQLDRIESNTNRE